MSFDEAVTCALERLSEAFDSVTFVDGAILARRVGSPDAVYDIQEFPWASLEEEVAMLKDLFGDGPDGEE